MKAVLFDFTRTLYDPEKRVLKEGALELLEWLKKEGILLGLISKDEGDKGEQIKPISSFFNFVRICPQKTEKDFQEFLELLSLAPTDVIVIGDKARTEIRLGKKVGMKTIWLRSGKYSDQLPQLEEEEPDVVCLELSEITRFLKRGVF